ncbi:MAG TPA: PAS domain-containing sensor histidine kinase, partial [Flavobacteriales bacterium]|nr:PAS domain-containing sensor histidine kinase [Flavobacteriales bacterium]
PASFMFVVINASLIVSSFGRKWYKPAVIGACVCIGISALSLLGYLFQAQNFYLLPGITGIALNTSLCFVLVGCGLIASLPGAEPMRTLMEASATGALVRRALPLLVVVPVGIGLLRWWGERAGYYDGHFGVVLRTVIEMVVLLVVLWWVARVVRTHERQRWEGEQAVRASEQRYLAFVQNSSEGIWLCELARPMPIGLPLSAALDWVYEHAYMAECNDAMAKMYGYIMGSELVGARLGDLLPRTPENEAYLGAFMAAGYKLNDGQSEERDKDGNTVYFSNNLVGIVENGALLRAWGTQVDITEQKRIESAMVDAARRKDEFLATLAHELRNPLSTLMFGIELINTDAPGMEPTKLAEVKGMMHRQLRHLVRLVDDLLDINRINLGKISLRRERFEFSTVFHKALESNRPLFETMGHALETDLPSQALPLEGDPERLVQVFANLLNNAAKFTPAGGRIRFSAEQSGGQLVVMVEDNGIGVAPEHLVSIFEMFSQVDTTRNRERSGLGIGLALVERLVTKHGGSITAFSAGLGRGTSIRVQLPLVAKDTEPLAAGECRVGTGSLR